jgi:lipoate-protein ligase A
VTGGRAVLHHHELTYCLTAPAEGAFHGLSVIGVYDWASSAIRAALEALGVTLDPSPPMKKKRKPREPSEALPCFAVPTGHEITAGGKKLVGSAQKWSRRGFLQHGSILLRIDCRLWQRTTGLGKEDHLQAVGLDTLVGKEIALNDLTEAMGKQFGILFGEPGASSCLSHEELQVAKTLAQEKYSSDSWNVSRLEGDGL